MQDAGAHAAPGRATLRAVPAIRRRAAVVLAAALSCGLAGCGGSGDDYANKPRPASPINVTAAIIDQEGLRLAEDVRRRPDRDHHLQPDRQRRRPLTLETQELGGSKPGIKQSDSNPIGPRDTGTLKVDVREGTYELSARDGRQARDASRSAPTASPPRTSLLEP